MNRRSGVNMATTATFICLKYLKIIPRARMGSESIAHELKLDFNPSLPSKKPAIILAITYSLEVAQPIGTQH